MESWEGGYIKGMGGGGFSCLPLHHLQPPARKPPGGGAEISLTASRGGRKGQEVPATGCALRAPSPAARDFPGQARFSGELLPRERTELPLGCGAPVSPPPLTSHWGVTGQDPEWVALKSPVFPQERIRWPRRRAGLDSPGGTQREAGSGVGGRGWRGAGGGSSGAGPPSISPSSFHPTASGSGPPGSREAGRAGASRLEAGRLLSRRLPPPSLPAPAAPLSS